MRPRRKMLLIGAAAFLLVSAAAAWIVIPSNRARHAAERTRHELRAHGFKLAVKEFYLGSSAEQRTQAQIILRAGRACAGLMPAREFDLVRPLATNAALLVHVQPKLGADPDIDWWGILTEGFEQRRDPLDQACVAAQTAFLRFEPAIGSDGELVLSYLTELRSLAMALAARTVLELHYSNHLAAVSNLMALTRLATAWNIEPLEQAHYLRFFIGSNAERALWEALHSPGWTDPELARLQKEWETPDFFRDLPEIEACSRALVLDQQQRAAQNPPPPPAPMRLVLYEFFSSPAGAWSDMQSRFTASRYHRYGVYEEQTEAMLYYRQREEELSAAIHASSWSVMRSLPGITNTGPVRQAPGSSSGARFVPRFTGGGFRQGSGLARRAAEVEGLRRLAVTALALERYRLSKGGYPESLASLCPAYLSNPPIDFMDGKALRYRLRGNDSFILYSTGLDCIDDGGVMMRIEPQTGAYNASSTGPFGRRDGPDVLWPRPASPEEVRADLAARRERINLK